MVCVTLSASTPPLCSGLRRISRSFHPFFISPASPFPTFYPSSSRLSYSRSFKARVSMDVSAKEQIKSIDPEMLEEYASQSKLLQEFSNYSNIKKAWIFKSNSGNDSQAMFSVGQANLLANTKRTSLLSSYISNDDSSSVKFHWSPFPIEMIGISSVIPSPSGCKILVVRNKDNKSPTQLEIWDSAKLIKEIQIPKAVHGSIFTDGWFEGISWNSEENAVAYVAEEPSRSRPTFDDSGFKNEGNSDKDCGSWKGQGDWEENWGETYAGKRRPALFVVSMESGEVRAVDGIPASISVGQVVWAPLSSNNSHASLVFVGWKSENGDMQTSRMLGMKYCYNRPCSLYVVYSPFKELQSDGCQTNKTEESTSTINLTPNISSAFFPRFSPDEKSLVFLSAKTAVDSGAHSATNSLHKIDWPVVKVAGSHTNIYDVVPVVMCAKDGDFPGLYCPSILENPWLSDGRKMILDSYWGSTAVIVCIDVFSGKISRASPADSNHSWAVLALNEDDILAVSSSPVDPPQIKYGRFAKEQPDETVTWDWSHVKSPLPGCSEKVRELLSSLKFDILKIPIINHAGNTTEGSRRPIEAIFLSSSDSQSKEQSVDGPTKHLCNPMIVILHGGPHSVSLASYSKNSAFLAALGYNLLIVNYRGSLGFGEEALQSLPGKIGSQDVSDVLVAMDHVIELGHADPSKIAVLGGSHGGFLGSHLIGQAPDRFKVAALRNPVCNLALMVGTTDIPDWCFVESYGTKGLNSFTEAPPIETQSFSHQVSNISSFQGVSYLITGVNSSNVKVKAPVLMLLGAQDLRVPVSNGLQYARTLKERGAEVKVLVFPNDIHGIEKPQSDFESFLNIGVWFKKYCK